MITPIEVKRTKWYNNTVDYSKLKINPQFEIVIKEVIRGYGRKLEANRKATKHIRIIS